MGILITLGIIGIILFLFAKKMSQIHESTANKRMEPINKMNNEYEKK